MEPTYAFLTNNGQFLDILNLNCESLITSYQLIFDRQIPMPIGLR